MRRLLLLASALAAAVLVSVAVASAQSFTNTVLRAPFPGVLPPGVSTNPPNQSGDSEPAIDFGGPSHTMAVDGLGWLPFAVNMWKGHFGDTPDYFGPMDTQLPIQGNGRLNLGDGDADVEVTSEDTILLADLDIIFNGGRNNIQLGVSVTRCPASATSPAGCRSVVLDTAGADRPWITTRGTEAWVSYHDSTNSTMISVWHSGDDGRTWRRVASPVVGQGGTTAGSTFNNSLGPIVADPTSNYIYQPFMAGDPQTKGFTANFNNVYVGRSADGGLTWSVARVFRAAPFTRLNNFWPAMAVDDTTGKLWVAWTDQHGVAVSTSADPWSEWDVVGAGDRLDCDHDGDAVGRCSGRQGRRRLLRQHGRLDRPGGRSLEHVRLAVQERRVERPHRQQHAEPRRPRLPRGLGMRGQSRTA